MANLYSSSISNEELIAQKSLRHRRFNMDLEYMFEINDLETNKKLSDISWKTVDFVKKDIHKLTNDPGIYMFIINPYSLPKIQHNASFVLYVGQATKLKDRLSQYFHYPNSRKPTDQEKRTLILLWGDYLKVKYFTKKDLSKIELDTLEYGIIDSILPPFNQQFKAEFAKSYVKLIDVR